MQNQFRLDDLLARDVIPQWFEGVAIVQLVCRQLRAEGRESGFPSPRNILIVPGGSVVTAGGSEGEPVQAAAHVLGLMLGSDVPVRLRLAVSQATATDGGFATLIEFSEALAYFERPNPEGIVEAFRQRALVASPREIAPPVRVEPAPAIEKQGAPSQPTTRRGVSRVALAAATVSAFACASIWVLGHRLPDLLRPQGSTAETRDADARTVRANTKSVMARTAAPKRETDAGTARTSLRVPPSEPAVRSGVAAPPELQVVATTLGYRYPTLLAEPAPEVPATTQSTLVAFAETRSPAPDTLDRIYSKADPQVTLPLSVYPRFPSDPPQASGPAGTTLELTIATNGLVERVRMLTAPRNIHEFMLLSAAKAWRFEPARIDGRPVRFRQLMTLIAIP